MIWQLSQKQSPRDRKEDQTSERASDCPNYKGQCLADICRDQNILDCSLSLNVIADSSYAPLKAFHDGCGSDDLSRVL